MGSVGSVSLLALLFLCPKKGVVEGKHRSPQCPGTRLFGTALGWLALNQELSCARTVGLEALRPVVLLSHWGLGAV